MTKRRHPKPDRTGLGRGSRTSTGIEPSSCNSRAISTVRGEQSSTGYHRCHDESRADKEPRTVKPTFEPPVRTQPPSPTGLRSEPGRHGIQRLGASDMDALPPHSELDGSQHRQGHSRPSKAPRVSAVNMGTSIRAPGREPGKPSSQAMSRTRGGASVVVGARESRAHGEGRQWMGTASKPAGKATYVATRSDKDWLRIEQTKLYGCSWKNPDYEFCKLWGLVTDPRNLRIAVERVAHNVGRRSAGVDGMTVATVLREGTDAFVD